MLAAIFRTEPAAAQDDDQGVGLLKLRELSMRSGLIGKLIVGERRAHEDVFSHAHDRALLLEERKKRRVRVMDEDR
jgi:hypothetical protein